jgi:hypothetical protein
VAVVPANPSADPATQRAKVLEYADDQRKNHRNVEKTYQWCFFIFQAGTIIAAAVATLMAVDETLTPVWRAAPAALATLGTSVLAAFQFRGGWRRHRTASRLLEYEILKFRNDLREYRPDEPRPQTYGVDVFLERVESISRSGDEEADTEKEAALPEEDEQGPSPVSTPAQPVGPPKA